MSVTALRPILHVLPGGDTGPDLPAGQPDHPTAENFARALLHQGLIPPAEVIGILAVQSRRRARLADALLARGLLPETALHHAQAAHWRLGLIDPMALPPDPRLVDRLGLATCLAEGLLPWRHSGGATVILTPYPEDFHRHRAHLETLFGPLILALASARAIEGALMAARGNAAALAAENSVSDSESCRSYSAQAMHLPVALAALGLLALLLAAPAATFLVLTLISVLAMLSFTGLKVAAWIAATRPPRPEAGPVHIAHLPIVSVMVALYRESDIAARLVERLGELDYPRELLDVLLVVEAEDDMTRAALARETLPPWMRVVAVPDGTVRTKPRALNFALDHCRGPIVGVYDAEDAPEPAQIRKVVEHFARRGPDVACLQGRLDFYNPRKNWLARCFTVEYASWFRLFLPGIERLGLAVPLGGTTLFFRRAALDRLGRWDAHNVTEDADLGMRLARHGYRTELVDTTTYEEANCHGRAWVKQRSRWIKGFMMTWLTHMRDPVRLWRELGPRRFFGFQMLLLGSVMQALTAPLLWTFWLVPFGVPHPVAGILGPDLFRLLWLTFFATEGLTIAFGIAGVARTAHRLNPLWVPSLSLYHPMATASAWKAAREMLTKPFWWDKTSHGQFGG
ncbi:glycosyltransferase [Tabrizicola fusiformis]|uniref:glycosyltransferase n=1 Tax=Tabrizicola sp. SY72 TaxID=2741673 RepID=UPI0015748225|nr:glycosyltransferase [Tabrizicola sp. SY72]NTT86060.1 glycosyltransferase [Tabrizicola sp. SY72]